MKSCASVRRADPSSESFTHRTLAAAVECLRVLSPRTFFAWRRVIVDQTTVNAIEVLLADIIVGSELEEFVADWPSHTHRGPDGSAVAGILSAGV